MKALLSLLHVVFIFSVFLSSSSSKYAVTPVGAFCPVVSSSSSSSASVSSTEQTGASFGISITSLTPTSLNSLNDDDNDVNDSDNDSDNESDNNSSIDDREYFNHFDKYKNMAMNDEIRKQAQLEKKQSLQSKERFATGEELTGLREDLKSLKQNLEWAKALQDDARIESLEKAIRTGKSRDPFFMYTKAQKLIKEVKKMEDVSDEEKNILIEKWSGVATDARELLPHLNMEGLWVGNYGDKKGLQLINITYSGDELIATKVTGDVNVPRGERSFTVNVAHHSNSSALPPVKVISEHRSGEFRRFPGKGQISRKGFKNNRFVVGQMILFENRFSFVWIPTKHHVLFHRPSPEMTLKLLRNTISKEDEVENMRNHVSRCYDMDLCTAIARQQDPFIIDEPLRRITTQEELEQVEERLKQSDSSSRNIFFQIGKWRNYIDQVLDKKSS